MAVARPEHIAFGIIGLGLMGREFASAAARWQHLFPAPLQPEIVAICSTTMSPEREQWYRSMCPSISQVTTDYRDLLENPRIQAVYIAVPHNFHREIYIAAVEAGKHVMGEKPFGIDREANEAINSAIAHTRERRSRANEQRLLVRCATQFAFIPGMQRIGRAIEHDDLGQILEVEAGFLHSGDLDLEKPINWKRRIATNGEYGCMGDLGMHVCHLPFRAGWKPKNVRAVLSNVVPERPDGHGGRTACETWDNATLFCEAASQSSGESFPMTLKTQRIAPGETNTLYLKVLGTRRSYRFSTKNINVLEELRYTGGEQHWCTIDIGHEVSFPSVTGSIFEFGFSDAILQMWAAFMTELGGGEIPGRFAGCARPDELALSHRLFTAALQSHERGVTAPV